MKNKNNLYALSGSLIFLGLCAIALATRHIVDDELFNLGFIKYMGFGELLSYTQHNDVHPPLSYLVNYLSYALLPDENLAIIPNLLFNAWALYYFYLNAVKYLEHQSSKLILLLLVFANPQLLMWGISLRWYSLWFAFFLTSYTLIFLKDLEYKNYLLGSLVLAASLYVGYHSLFVAPFVYLLYCLRKPRLEITKLLSGPLLFLGLGAPQLYYFFTVHLKNNATQTNFSLLRSLFSSLYSTVIGNSLLPWHPAAAAFALAACGLAFLYILKKFKNKTWFEERKSEACSLALAFIALNLMLYSFTMLGGKTRNTYFLNIVFAFVLSVVCDSLRPKARKFLVLLSAAFIAFSTLNVLSQKDTSHERFNLPVRQVLQEAGKFSRGETLFCVHDAILAFYLHKAGFKTCLDVKTNYPEWMEKLIGTGESCELSGFRELVVVDSYLPADFSSRFSDDVIGCRLALPGLVKRQEIGIDKISNGYGLIAQAKNTQAREYSCTFEVYAPR